MGNKILTAETYQMKISHVILLCLLLFVFDRYSKAQNNVGIGTITPNPNAVLELVSPSANQGFLPPRLTTLQRDAIASLGPVDEGLVIYNITDDELQVFDGSGWLGLNRDNLGDHTATQNLNLAGFELFNGGGVTSAGTITFSALGGSGDRMLKVNNGGVLSTDPLPTDAQTLSLSGSNLSISGGNSVTLPTGSDNLGNHIATTNIQLNGNWLSEDGDNEGLFVRDDGNVGIGNNNPGQRLQVNGNARITGEVISRDFRIQDLTSGDDYYFGGNDDSYEDVGIELRARINPTDSSSLFRIMSAGGNERLRVEHNGVTSTTNDLLVEGSVEINREENNPNPRTVYGNNICHAWGRIQSNGNLISPHFGIATSTRFSTGRYRITLDNPIDQASAAVMATCEYNGGLGSADRNCTFEFINNTTIEITIVEPLGGSTNPWNEEFSLLVFGSPL